MRVTRPLAFICVTALLDSLGLTLVIPILPGLLKSLPLSVIPVDIAVGVVAAIYAVFQFVFAPILGMLSDRYGRRPLLLLSMLGAGLDYVLLYLAPTLWWVILGRALAGMAGASITVANAYVADVSSNADRARAFGYVHAMFSVGFIIGPAIGGFLGNIDLRLPFAVAAGLSLINFAFGYFALPESLPPRNRRRTGLSLRALNPMANLLRVAKLPGVGSVLAVLALFWLAYQLMTGTWVLFTTDALGWSTAKTGNALAAYGAMTLLVQILLIAPATRRFGDRGTAMIGVAVAIAEFILLGLATNDVVIYASLAVGAFSSLSFATLQSIATKRVDASRQGMLQGAITGVESLTGIVGPLIGTTIFWYATMPGSFIPLPGAPFLLGAISMAMSLVILTRRTSEKNGVVRAL